MKNYFVVVGTTGKNGVLNVDKAAQSFINEFNRGSGQDAIHIELFKDEDLMYNVLKHDLVPKHIIMSEDEKANLLAK